MQTSWMGMDTEKAMSWNSSWSMWNQTMKNDSFHSSVDFPFLTFSSPAAEDVAHCSACH